MSRNKAKGTGWEVAVRDYLNERFGRDTIYRPAQAGFRDTGDLHGMPYFAIQCKNWANVTNAVRDGIDGVLKQTGHAGKRLGVNIVKRARKNVRLGYAVMTLEHWRAMAYAMARADALLEDQDVRMIDLIEEGLDSG